MSLLTADIGNTHTVLGLFRGEELVDEWRLSSTGHMTPGHLWSHIRLLCQEAHEEPTKIAGYAIASVVPGLTRVHTVMAKKHLPSATTLVISGELESGLRNSYQEPAQLGADRICAAAAAYDRYGGPIIVIDFGTATTYDVVSGDGEFLGGVIAPGVEILTTGLAQSTAKLPHIEFVRRAELIGTNTVDCMHSGIFHSVLDSLEGMIDRLKSMTGKKTIVVATGGYGAMIHQHTEKIDHLDPSLVLHGARLIFEIHTNDHPQSIRTKKKRGA